MTLQTFKLREAQIFDGVPQVWRQLTPSMQCSVPTMLCSDEIQYLYYLAKRQYSGRGVIVDCGPLAGASTMAFVSGVPRGTKIHVYDLWSFCPGWEEFFPRRLHNAGDDLLPEFLSNLGEFRSAVTTHKGDLAAQHWRDEPIELMFIDAAKTPQVMHRLVGEFFPCLVPGAFVVHQDYVCSQCPWIHVAVMMLRDYFEWVDSPSGGTVCARLMRPVPRGVLSNDYFDSLTDAEAEHFITQAADVCLGWERLCVKLAGATLFILRNQKDRAARIRAEVVQHPDFIEAYVGPDLAMVDALT
jgi:hypothetical protein